MKLNLALGAIDALYQTTMKNKLPHGGKENLIFFGSQKRNFVA
jgi:hypothetical protein